MGDQSKALIEILFMSWFITFSSWAFVSTLQYANLKYREFLDFKFPSGIPDDVKKKLLKQSIDNHLEFYAPVKKETEDVKEEPLNS